MIKVIILRKNVVNLGNIIFKGFFEEFEKVKFQIIKFIGYIDKYS